MDHIEDSLTLLSDTLFWEGYEVWKKRKLLIKNFWKHIAPNEWKMDQKEAKGKSKRKMQTNCKNPFYFCKKISDLSKQRKNLCACSDITRCQVETEFLDIRHFLTKYPKRVSTIATLHPVPPKTVDALVRDDLVRKEHDRGKKKKRKNRKSK